MTRRNADDLFGQSDKTKQDGTARYETEQEMKQKGL